MKAFFAGLVIAILIAGGTAIVYAEFGISAEEYFSTSAAQLSS
jgi:hypothetical protein